MTEKRIRDLIEDACFHFGTPVLANEYLRDALGGHLVRIDGKKGMYRKTWWYTVYPNDTNDYVIVAYDFGRQTIL